MLGAKVVNPIQTLPRRMSNVLKAGATCDLNVGDQGLSALICLVS
jgi:hypothetical protein